MSARPGPAAPALHVVTDTAPSAPGAVPDVVAAAVAGGATMVQVQDENTSARDLVGLLVAVHAPRTEPDHPEPLGVEAFAAAAARSALPCLVVGGMRAEDAAALRTAGAAGLAVVSGICTEADPAAAAARYVRASGRPLPEGDPS